MGTISANHKIEINLYLPCPLPLTWSPLLPHFEPGFVFSEVSACEFMAKVEGDIRHFFQDVKETLVETAAVDSKNGL